MKFAAQAPESWHIFAQVPTSILVTDLNCSIVYVNACFSEVTGYALDEVLGKNPRILQSGKTLESTYRQLWEALHAGMTWDGELVNRRKDGRVFHEHALIAPFFNSNGVATHYMLVMEDISRNRQAEESLRLSEHRMQLLGENARDVIWTMSPEGKTTYISPVVKQFRGYSAAEAMQQTLQQILAPASQLVFQKYFQQLHDNIHEQRSPPDFRGELEYCCKDGTTVWAEVLLYPLFSDEGFVEMLGMSRDISEHLRRRSALESEAKRLAEQIVLIDRQRTLGQMSAALGHELTQPLTALMVDAKVIQRGLRNNQIGVQKIGALVDRIIQNTHRAGSIIQGIRSFIRPTTNTHQVLDLQDIVRDTLDLIHADTLQHRVVIRLQALACSLPIRGDPIQLSQVLFNILRNAIEALEQVAQREIHIQMDRSEDLAHLRITDSGAGLTPQQLQLAGTPCFSTKSSGLGMGLSICKKIMADHHGTLDIANAANAGACVLITLPLAEWLNVPIPRNSDTL
jgi:PAS domain S-box-containing protein